MDAPIYIHRLFYDKDLMGKVEPPAIRNHLYVIEDRDGSAGEEIVKTDTDRIGVYKLPDLIDIFYKYSFFVAGSRLFIIGRASYRREEDAILYLDYAKPNGRWEKTAIGDFEYLAGIAALDVEYVSGMSPLDVYRIECFGEGKNFSFIASDVKPTISSFSSAPGLGMLFPVTLAVTPEKRVYVYWYSSEDYGELGYYEESGEWHSIDGAAIWPGRSKSAVVVKDKYLITFSDYHPEHGPEIEEHYDYVRGLYVCDIRHRGDHKSKWLADPVKGLLHDNHAFPLSDDFNSPAYTSLAHTSLVQVSAVKFALIWVVRGPDYPEDTSKPNFQLHCTKFTLSIQDEDTDSPIFSAQLSSTICCQAGDLTVRVSSTCRAPLITQMPMKRKCQALES